MGKFIDLTGKKFGKLTVLKRSNFSVPRRGVYWNCICECGNVVDVESQHLRSGKKKSCGCWYKERLVGKRFGRLTVLEFAGSDNKDKDAQFVWKCACDCGNIVCVKTGNLMSGNTLSCGCYHKDIITKHNISKTKLYRAYYSMLERCNNPNSNVYKYYGGRDIKVCDEWSGKNGVFSFYKWSMKNGWSDGLSLDRIDVNGDYEPSNCRWTSTYIQMNNTRRNRYVEIDGDIHTITEWSRISHVNPKTISQRLDHGWSNYDAVMKPPIKHKKKVE